MHRFMLLLVALWAGMAAPADAQQNAFDLVGPTVSLSVSRGDTTLPIAWVPALQAGDRLTGEADLPRDKSARYILVIGFLRGAATPPPKNWFFQTKTWKRSKKPFTVVVPEGAEQAIALLVPEEGGGFGAVVKAVRERPGAFVRAAQDLHQASLDRARLETFVGGIARIEESAPERLDAASPVLASSLGMRLNPECLTRQRALRAACLTQNRENLVLQGSPNSPSVGDRLAGAPTDLAYRIAATREAGAGYYSPYIGLARDLVRLFGAFRSTPYQYLPALAVGHGGAVQLRLNTPPSFSSPRSVLVVALPPVGPAPRPAWRAGGSGGLCLSRPGMVLPVENAALLYATGYASDLSLKVQGADGRSLDLPVTPDAERGGLILVEPAAPAAFGGIVSAALQGRWGFDRFEDLSFSVQNGAVAGWAPRPDGAVIVGRDHPLVLGGGAPACVERVTLRAQASEPVTVAWKPSGRSEITATLPLTRVRPGPLELVVGQSGSAPVSVKLLGQSEPSRLDSFVLHAGDRDGVLTGARLDQVAEVRLGTARFAPGALVYGDQGDRLAVATEDTTADLQPGASRDAVVRLRDGRTAKVPVRIAAPRPGVALISRNVAAPPSIGGYAFTLPEGVVEPQAMLTFSFRSTTGLQPDDAVEIATEDGSAQAKLSIASGGLQRAGADVGIATVRPAEALGLAALGSLRFRLLRGDVKGDWQPLVDVVRLPTLDQLSCPEEGSECSLSGSRLFLLAAVADTPAFTEAQAVPAGFVGSHVVLRRPASTKLYLRLRDAPNVVVQAEPRGGTRAGAASPPG